MRASLLVERLEPPTGLVDVVLDTDTFNDIDDQFAVVYAMLAKNHVALQAIYAAPFHNLRSSSPEDGMRKSLEEIERLLQRLGDRPSGGVLPGSTRWLTGSAGPEVSPAATDLIERALAASPPLYVLACGAITNVASALQIEPAIADKIVVVWVTGNPQSHPNAADFNIKQDPDAARFLFDCGVPLVHIPCVNVAKHLRISLPELAAYARDVSPIGEYLYEIVSDHIGEDSFGVTRVIHDIAPVAWVINPDWLPSRLVASPILTERMTWSINGYRHLIRECDGLKRDTIFRDFFALLKGAASLQPERVSTRV